MSQIIQDPAKLRSFCSELASNAAFWEAMLKDLENGMGRLGNSWRDDQYHAFKNEIYSVLRSIEKFSEDTKKTIDELNKDAERLEKYQSVGR
jgi:uncharacterized protein YukE